MPTITLRLPAVKSNKVHSFASGLPHETQIRAPRGGCTVKGKVFKGGQFCLPYDVANPHGEPETTELSPFLRSAPSTVAEINEAFEYHSWLDRISGSKPLALPEGDEDEEARWAAIMAEGHRPSVEPTTPSPEEQAWWLGFTLGMDGEYPAPVGIDADLTASFYGGRLSGFPLSPEGIAWGEDVGRWREIKDHEDRMEAAFGEPGDGASDGERMEVMGSAAFPRRNDWD